MTEPFGKIAVRLGHVSQSSVDEALGTQEELRTAGIVVRIGQILRKRNQITDAQVAAVFAEQNLDSVLCAVCGKVSAPDSNLTCACGAHLLLTEDLDLYLGEVSESLVKETAAGPGTLVLGRYEILGELGSGGMARVLKARDRKLERDVALKFLHRERRDEPMVKRFIQEARIIAKLSHPGILQVHDISEHEGELVIVMQLIEGVTMQERGLSRDKALEVVEKVAEAVHHAHDEGIIHRDLKPANVLLDENDAAFVADFGLAKDIRSDSGSRSVAGTPGYMAPEQLSGGKIDRRTDVYALGVMLMEILRGDPRPEGSAVAWKASAEMPADRYGSAQDLADDVRALRHGEPVSARLPGPFERATRHLRRRWWSYGTAVLASAMLLLLWVYVSGESRRGRDLKDVVRAAIAFEENADWQNAMLAWERASILESGNPEHKSRAEACLQKLGRIQIQMEHVEKRVEDYEDNLQGSISEISGHQKNLLLPALQICEEIILENKGGPARAWSRLSEIYVHLARWRDAWEAADSALALSPDAADLRWQRGIVALKVFVSEARRNTFTWMPIRPERVPDEWKTWRDDAVSDLASLRDNDVLSDYDLSYIEGCIAYLESRTEDAMSLFQGVTEDEVTPLRLKVEALKMMGFLQYQQGHFEKGETFFTRATQEIRCDFESHLWAGSGRIMAETRRTERMEPYRVKGWDDAIEFLKTAGRIMPESREVRKRLGIAMLKRGDARQRKKRPGAKEDLEAALGILRPLARTEKEDIGVFLVLAETCDLLVDETKDFALLDEGIQNALRAAEIVVGPRRRTFVHRALYRLYLARSAITGKEDRLQAADHAEKLGDLELQINRKLVAIRSWNAAMKLNPLATDRLKQKIAKAGGR